MGDVHTKAFFDAVKALASAVEASPEAMAVDPIRGAVDELYRSATAANRAEEEEFREMLRLTAEQPCELYQELAKYLVPVDAGESGSADREAKDA